jgi:hypothetical protein
MPVVQLLKRCPGCLHAFAAAALAGLDHPAPPQTGRLRTTSQYLWRVTPNSSSPTPAKVPIPSNSNRATCSARGR